MKSDKISNGAIFGSIIITIMFGFSFACLNYAPNHPDSFPLFPETSPWLIISIYLVCHPIIGKIFSVIVEILCKANDYVYDFEKDSKWGDWEREKNSILRPCL